MTALMRSASAASATVVGIEVVPDRLLLQSNPGDVSSAAVTVINTGTTCLDFEWIPQGRAKIAPFQVSFSYLGFFDEFVA